MNYYWCNYCKHVFNGGYHHCQPYAIELNKDSLNKKEIMKYILVYYVKDFPEMGGGLYYLIFNSVQDMDLAVNNLDLNKTIIKFAGEVRKEFKYQVVEKIVKMERVDI